MSGFCDSSRIFCIAENIGPYLSVEKCILNAKISLAYFLHIFSLVKLKTKYKIKETYEGNTNENDKS